MFSWVVLRQRRMGALPFLFLLGLSAEMLPARQNADPPRQADLELVISGPREDFPDRNWRQYHRRNFKMTLINHSSRPIVFGPNAPGMFAGYGSTDWRATDSTGKPVPYRPMYICPVGAVRGFPTRRITDSSLFVIQPGESRDLGDFDLTMLFLFTEPGEYKIYRVFSFSPPRLLTVVAADGQKYPAECDASAMSPKKRQMLRDAIPFTIESNVWTLTIKRL